MTALVIGGAASGKSAFAEALTVNCGSAPRYYVATLMPFGGEDDRRINRHRTLRAGKGFSTLERYTDLAGLAVPAPGAALLECLGNLTANELYDPAGAGENAASAILEGLDQLAGQCAHLIVVSNEVFSGGADYAGDTGRYLKALAQVNNALAARADHVVRVVCGIPVYYKGVEK